MNVMNVYKYPYQGTVENVEDSLDKSSLHKCEIPSKSMRKKLKKNESDGSLGSDENGMIGMGYRAWSTYMFP